MLQIETAGLLIPNESLANYTSWRVGGNARYLYKPCGLDDLSATLARLPQNLPVMFLGLGSNTLVRDGGFNGIVVMTQGAMKDLSISSDGIVSVEVGVSCASMARFCARAGFAEAEFWAGIPGTMGGALRMNAGCFGGETWTHLISVETVNQAGERCVRDKSEFITDYRHVSGLGPREWFVSAKFKLPKGDKAESLENIKVLLAKRAQTQPTGEYNCGSVFRNPANDYAARLIEHCGLKGKSIGGASVSEKHANFITNNGQAKAAHIEALIEFVGHTVSRQCGITLNREVHIIGEGED